MRFPIACLAGIVLGQDDGTWLELSRLAKERSERAFVERKVDDVPEWLKKLDYDGYRRVRFRPDCFLWSGENLPFSIQFHHRGYLFTEKTAMWELVGGERRELAFAPDQFEYPSGSEPVPQGLGYSGFGARMRSDGKAIGDEFAAFQGASYFRLLPRGLPYGASLRGLAIDTASDRGEEFPAFVEIWLEKPSAKETDLAVYALLDSPSAAGAFRFRIVPGERIRAEVQAAIFPRKKIEKLGLAPLTSMFLNGEDRSRSIPDWRPEVHDSDGLLIQSADGAWLWRPLQNPHREHQIQRFPLENPAGFGLVQRDRSFASYEDLESRYERRPSYWVTPRGAWGKGAVELVEIPTSAERNENIVAYWVPERPVEPGQTVEFAYEIHGYADDPARPPLARAKSVRTGRVDGARLFVIDFVGEGLHPSTDVRAELHSGKGETRHAVLQPNEAEGGRRFTFELVDGAPEPLDLRVTLRSDGGAVSETLVLPWTKR